MSVKLLSVLAVATLVLASGCTETEVKESGVNVRSMGESAPKATTEKDLLEKCKKDPKDAQAWFELGDYYEGGLELTKAAQSYENGNSLIDQNEYTGGNYVLGKVYSRMKEFDRAMQHLDAVIRLESKDPKVACLNPHFRESHYLKGAILYVHNRYADAKKEFLRFVELGGDEIRVAEWLENIRREGA